MNAAQLAGVHVVQGASGDWGEDYADEMGVPPSWFVGGCKSSIIDIIMDFLCATSLCILCVDIGSILPST